MFDFLFGEGFTHKITFGLFGKPAAAAAPAPAPAAAAAPAPAQVGAPAPGQVGAPAPGQATGAAAEPKMQEVNPSEKKPVLQDLQSEQGGGGRKKRRGSRKNRSKSKIGGSSMGFGRVGGKNKRSSRKKNTHKRRN